MISSVLLIRATNSRKYGFPWFTDSDVLRIIFPNKELRDFMGMLVARNEPRTVDNVAPNNEEVVVVESLDPWDQSWVHKLGGEARFAFGIGCDVSASSIRVDEES